MYFKFSMNNTIFFLAGFFSIVSAFYLSLFGLNIRIYETGFYLLFLLTIITLFTKANIRKNYGFSLVAIIVIYYFINILQLNNTNDIYEIFGYKYFINKMFFLIVYAIAFVLFREKLLVLFMLGLVYISFLNSALIWTEYLSLLNGTFVSYDFLPSIVSVDIKKEGIINQGLIRPSGLTVDPNYAAAYLGLSVVFLEKYKVLKNNFFIFLLQIFFLSTILLVFSRTAMLALILSFLFSVTSFVLYRKKLLLKEIVFIMLILIGVVLSILIVDFPDLYENVLTRLFLEDSSGSTRLMYLEYYFSISNIFHILFGNGSGASGYILSGEFNSSDFVWSPESIYITLLIEQGLIFLVLFFLMSLIVLYKLFKKDYIYSLLFVYLLSIGLTYNYLGDRIYLFIYVMLLMFAFQKGGRIEKSVN